MHVGYDMNFLQMFNVTMKVKLLLVFGLLLIHCDTHTGLSYSKKRARDKSYAQFVLRARFCTNILRVLAILIAHIL